MCANACSFMTALGYSEDCGVVEPAVLSIDCYFEAPADGTAVSLGETRPSEVSSTLRQGRGGEGASGDTWHASSQCVRLASEDLTATWLKQKPARKTCFRFFFFSLQGLKRGIISFNSWLQPDRDHKRNPSRLLA